MVPPTRLAHLAAPAVVAAVAALLLAAPASTAGAETIRATGRFQCRLRWGPVDIPYASVKMLNKNFAVSADETMGRSTTDATGAFSFSGRGGDLSFGRGARPDPYVRLTYDYAGLAGRLDVDIGQPVLRTLAGYRGDRTAILSNKKGSVSYGTVVIDSLECRTYVAFYNALVDWRSRTGAAAPIRALNVRTRVLVSGGTAYTLYDAIKIPSGTVMDDELGQHELAHAVRHTLDGSLAHFVGDVAKYVYTRNHNCTTDTNEGYAFNEGWAAYWAGECGLPWEAVPPADRYTVEGNVAQGLRRLQAGCGTSDAQMVATLNKRRAVHSYGEFDARHRALNNC